MKKILAVSILSFALVSFVNAQTGGGAQAAPAGGGAQAEVVTLQNPLGGNVNSIGDLVFKVVNFLSGFLLAIAAFFIIYSGFKFVSAAGNPEKLKEAKDSLKNAIIGALLILAASTIGLVIQNLINSLQGK